MQNVLEFSVVFTVAILPQIISSVLSIRDREYFRRITADQRTTTNIARWLGVILLLMYVGENHADGLSFIGVSFDLGQIPQVLLVSAMTTAYLSLIFVLPRWRSKKVQEQIETRRKSVFEAGAFSTYRGFWERFGYLCSVWLDVIAEDLVFRGYLVLGLGSLTGGYLPWIVLSVSLSLVAHLYQGSSVRLMLGQGFFAMIFIAVSLFTHNVITAIIPHLVYDTVWFVSGWAKDSGSEPQ